MSNFKAKRKKLYVSKEIQGRAAGRFFLYWFIYHGVLWHAMFLFHFGQYKLGVLTGDPQVAFAELYTGFFNQYYMLIVGSLAVMPLVYWDVLRFTHRVAGPLVRFRRVLQQLSRGERVDAVKLRKGDLLTGLRDDFNAYLATLNQDASESEESAKPRARINALLDEIDEKLKDDVAPETADHALAATASSAEQISS